MHTPRSIWLTAMLALTLGACTTQRNYGPGEPRFGGGPAGSARPALAHPDTIQVVSFNIEYALRVDRALLALQDSAVHTADVLLLQEMDEAGTRRIADALGLWYVYYPATRHLRTNRDFGNAILSRWPIVDDAKILLPHLAALGDSRRTATAATIRIGETLVRFYSAHLGTYANVTNDERREQLETILEDAARYERVALGGDMNDPSVGEAAVARGYAWPTRRGPRTALAGRLDHIFLKGVAVVHNNGSGTVEDNRGASDHRPIWVRTILR